MSLAVVDLSGLGDESKKDGKEDEQSTEVDAEDALWRELISVLERLAKGVEGDVSALNRAVRSMNRFRGRMTDYTWGRLLYFLVPVEERPNLVTLLRVTTAVGWDEVRASVVARMTAHSIEEAQQFLKEAKDSVLDAVLAAVKSKEDTAVAQLVKEAKEAEEREAAELAEARLKQERLLKGSSTLSGSKMNSSSSSSSTSSSSTTGMTISEDKKKIGDGNATEKMSDYDITVSFLKEGSTRPATRKTTAKKATGSEESKESSSSSASASSSSTTESSAAKSSAKSSSSQSIAKKRRKKERRFYDETRVYLLLLIAYRYFDADNHADALKIVENVLQFCHDTNRRTLDLLCGRALGLFSLCHQRQSESSSMGSTMNNSSTQLRSRLFAEYKRAQLEQNENGQCVAINLILHNLIMCDQPLYSMASKFAKNSGFLNESADSTAMARNHYYCGRIATVELDYEQALHHLQHALRRAPQTGALGFKLSCVKWLATVHLLRGDIPDYSLLNGHARLNDRCRRELSPYIEVTQAVRNGELKKFTSTLLAYSTIFRKDGLSAVLLRLKQNVIKTGLRKISKSYSRISLFDISKKLGLESAKEAHLIVAKAILDGVITDCVIDYDKGELSTKETPDIYKSRMPYAELSKRVDFCLDIHTTAVKALRYPQKDDDEEEDEQKGPEEEDVDVEEIVEAIREAMEEDDD